MGLILDTSLIVAAERGRFDLQAFMNARASEVLAMATITVSELWVGLHRADPSRKARRQAMIDDLIAKLEIVPFDLDIAQVHSRLYAELMAAGKPMGAHDLIIAATAIHRGDSVATRDARSFPLLPTLKVELL